MAGGTGHSLLPSECNGFLASPFVTVRSPQTVFEDDRLNLPFIDRPQTSSSSADFLSQSFTSIDPSSSDTTSSAHTPQDSFTTTTPQAGSLMSPSQSALHPLALRWPHTSADSAYVALSSFMASFPNNIVTIDSGLEISGPRTAEEVYESITKPYDYTEGYHFLMKVLPFRYVSGIKWSDPWLIAF